MFSIFVGHRVEHIYAALFFFILFSYIYFINLLIKKSFLKVSQKLTGPLVQFTKDLTEGNNEKSLKEKSYPILRSTSSSRFLINF